MDESETLFHDGGQKLGFSLCLFLELKFIYPCRIGATRYYRTVVF